MTEEEKKKKLESIREKHPIGAIRWYFDKKCEVIDYDQVQSGFIYVVCNVEDPAHGGFATRFLTPDTLKEK